MWRPRVLWLLAALPLLPALTIGFLLDDFVGLTYFQEHGWAGVVHFFHPWGAEHLRPLGYLVVQLELSLFGQQAWLWHGLQLALFMIAAWCSGRLAGRLAGQQVIPWAAALAVLYPGRLETAVWVAGVFDALALLCVAAGLLLALSARRDGHWWQMGLLAVVCFVAPLTKEHAYALPGIIAGWELLRLLDPAPVRIQLVTAGAACGGALAAVLFRFTAIGGIGGYPGTTLSRVAEKLWQLPDILTRVVFVPVNPGYGGLSTCLAALCAVALAAVLVKGGGRKWRDANGGRLFLTGLVVLVVGSLPHLPYMDRNVVWHHSRYVAIPGLGVALMAASAAAWPRRFTLALLSALVAVWAGATTLNLLPWLEAARCRDVILAGIEQHTRAPGPHAVWLAGPIDQVKGAQLLGGYGTLAHAVRVALPGRQIQVDSASFQQYQGRPVGPPQAKAGVALHLFQFDPTGPVLRPLLPSPPAS